MPVRSTFSQPDNGNDATLILYLLLLVSVATFVALSWTPVVVQGDALNRSRIATVVCVPLTSNLEWADAPGNVRLAARSTSLRRDSVANVSQITALDRTFLTERVGKLSAAKVELLLSGIDDVDLGSLGHARARAVHASTPRLPAGLLRLERRPRPPAGARRTAVVYTRAERSEPAKRERVKRTAERSRPGAPTASAKAGGRQEARTPDLRVANERWERPYLVKRPRRKRRDPAE
jgi:mRNA interferase MazF